MKGWVDLKANEWFWTRDPWIGNPAPITLNVCKCLIVSLNLIKFLLWQQHHFCLFQLVPCLSVNLPWYQECIFYCAPRKKRYTLLPEGTDIHIQQHSRQKDLNPCVSLYCYSKVIVELENTQTRNLTVFMVFVIWPCSKLKFLFVFDFTYVWAIFSLSDCQQITFIMLNRFFVH